MRIVLASRVFAPEVAAASYRLSALVKAALRAGDEVCVLTTRVTPSTGNEMPVPEGPYLDVRRAAMFRARGAGVKRLISFVTFDIPLILRLLALRRPDVIVAEAPPSTALVCAVVGSMRRIPVVYYMGDLWSAMYSRSESVSSTLIRRLVGRMERAAIRRVTLTIAVTRASREAALSTYCVPGERVVCIPNGIDVNTFTPVSAPDPADPYCTYAGTVGVPQGALIFVKALAKIPVGYGRLVFFGNGAMWAELQAAARTTGLPLDLNDFVEPRKLSRVLSAASCALVSLRPDGGVSTAIPTKIFAAAACGCPVLYVGNGAAADLVEDERLGVVIRQWDSSLVAEALTAVFRSPWTPIERERLREWAREHASMDNAANEITHVLHQRFQACIPIQ